MFINLTNTFLSTYYVPGIGYSSIWDISLPCGPHTLDGGREAGNPQALCKVLSIISVDFSQLCVVGLNIPILHMRKVRFRGVKCFQGLRSVSGRSRIQNQIHPLQRPVPKTCTIQVQTFSSKAGSMHWELTCTQHDARPCGLQKRCPQEL